MSLVRFSNIIHPMHRSGRSISDIHKEIQLRDPTITYQKVRAFIQKHYSCRLPCTKACYRARKLSGVLRTVRKIIEDTYSADSSATIASIISRLRERNISVSASQLRRLRDRLGFRRTTTKYCHMIRDVNKEKRFAFCTRMIETNEDFSQCIFTDESTIQKIVNEFPCCIDEFQAAFLVDCSVKHCYVKEGDHFSRLRSRAKHPAKLHLWGGISMRGATELAIFPGEMRMDSEKYCQILERCYIPFNNNIYHGYGVLVQDNAPAHKSVYTSARLEMWKLRLLDWPPESPDLNPIELVWGNMKDFIRKQNVRSVEDLRRAAMAFWKTLTPAECAKYVLGVRKKLHRVVEQEGRNIYEGR